MTDFKKILCNPPPPSPGNFVYAPVCVPLFCPLPFIRDSQEFFQPGESMSSCSFFSFSLQGDQIDMAVFFWYLVKSDFCRIRYCTHEHWISHYLPRILENIYILHLQGIRNTRSCFTGHFVGR